MLKITNKKLIFISTVLYCAGCYIAEAIPGGGLILATAIGLMAFAVFSDTGGKVRVRNTGFIVYILFFLIFCIVSRLWARDASLSTNKINGLIFMLVGMVVIHLSFRSFMSVDDLLKAIMYGSYVVVVYAFLRFGFGGIIRLAVNETRFSSDAINGNTLGMCSAYAILINYYFIINEQIKPRDILVLPAVILLVVSQSRKAIIILALGVIGIYILKNLNRRNFGLSLLKLIGGLALLGVIFLIISRFPFMEPIVKRLKEILEMLAGAGTRANNSAWIRFAYVDLGIELFKKNPILGIGIGNANIYTLMYYGHDHYLHNNYIELLACGGLVGFLIFYSMHMYLIIKYIKYRKLRDKEYDICLVLLIVNLIVDYGVVSYYDKANYLFLFLFWLKIIVMEKQFGVTGKFLRHITPRK